MISKGVRKKFLDFFEENGHKIVPSSSLIPADPSVLFTTAGMQQFSLYLAGKKSVLQDFGTRHLASCQKCVRTGDIENIGDDTHHVFFEMLGNWSVGQDKEKGYFKEGSINYALEFLLHHLGIKRQRLWITIFKGENNISRDDESFGICRKLGFAEERILEFGMEDNFWGPVAQTGPCGPCLEIFYDRGEEFGCGNLDCGPNCARCKRFAELWTLVFMEYLKNEKGEYVLLDQKNVDTGMGLERLTAILNNKPSAYETDLFLPIISKLESLSGRKYQENKKVFRILADHIRASVFIASEGIMPSNVERGYILRRLLRRMMRFGKMIGLKKRFLIDLGEVVIKNYSDVYPEVNSHQADILTVFQNEEEKFEKTLERGLKETNTILERGDIDGKDAFWIYETYGFPLEMIEEIAKEKGRKIINKDNFEEEFKKHQEISRAGAEKKFGGIGEGASYKATKLHTATHLLHQALRQVLGDHVRQMGSDINSQRLRFDFSHPRKLTREEIQKVEDIVNQKIKEDLEVKKEEMTYEQAINSGALAFFKDKYPLRVSVYSIGNFSKEICAGPHVERTSELGHFRIIKEESSGAGVRRIRAILEKNN